MSDLKALEVATNDRKEHASRTCKLLTLEQQQINQIAILQSNCTLFFLEDWTQENYETIRKTEILPHKNKDTGTEKMNHVP